MNNRNSKESPVSKYHIKMLSSIVAYEASYKILLKYVKTGLFSESLREDRNNLAVEVEDLPNFVKPLMNKAIEHYNQYIEEEDKQWQLLVLPVIVNISFAIELTIKTLLSFNKTKFKNSHNLRYLFDLLQLEQKSNIKTFICDFIQLTEQAFEEALNQNNNHFERWRYFYEESITDRYKPNIDFLDALLQATKEELKKLLP